MHKEMANHLCVCGNKHFVFSAEALTESPVPFNTSSTANRILCIVCGRVWRYNMTMRCWNIEQGRVFSTFRGDAPE